MDIAYLFKALLNRKWLIILCVSLAVIAALLFTLNQKKEYKSTSQLSTGFTVSEEIKLSNENFNIPQIELKFNNVIENITSPRVLSLVAYRLMLNDLQTDAPFRRPDEKNLTPLFAEGLTRARAVEILTSKLNLVQMLSPTQPEERKLLSMLDVYEYDLEALYGGLKVARYMRTDYINIIFFSENPLLSAFVVNTLCSEYIRFYGIDMRARTGGSVINLDSVLISKKNKLDSQILVKTAFMSNEGVVDVNLEGSDKLNQISSYENQLIEEKGRQLNLSYTVQQMDALIATAKSKGLSSATQGSTAPADNTNSEYIRLRSEYNELNRKYIQSGRTDYEIKRKLDNISDAISKLNVTQSPAESNNNATTSIDDLVQRKIDAEAQLRATNQKVASITSRINQLRGGLTGMAEKGASIQQLDKEIQMASVEYQAAKDQLNVARTMNDFSSGNFKQTIYGEPALKPEPSKRILILALSAFAALFLSCLVIIAIELSDNSIKTPAQFLKLSGLPLLGVVSWVKLKEENILRRVVSIDDHKERENTFRELLRKLRYEIETSGKRVFLFTSTNPQQGKTTLIQALAYSLSLGKKKVLIIDTNFCNNDLTKAIQASPLLETFDMHGQAFNSDNFTAVVSHTEIEGIDIIGCEGGDYTPSEILPKDHLLNYLESMKGLYDYIFLEGAPLNGFTDTKELIKYADSMIAIFSAEAKFTTTDKESIEFLRKNSDKFLGAILNKVQEDNLEL